MSLSNSNPPCVCWQQLCRQSEPHSTAAAHAHATHFSERDFCHCYIQQGPTLRVPAAALPETRTPRARCRPRQRNPLLRKRSATATVNRDPPCVCWQQLCQKREHHGHAAAHAHAAHFSGRHMPLPNSPETHLVCAGSSSARNENTTGTLPPMPAQPTYQKDFCHCYIQQGPTLHVLAAALPEMRTPQARCRPRQPRPPGAGTPSRSRCALLLTVCQTRR
jgi:hypothetical protein